jgi:uncharacterized protein (TIGR00645 family)
MEKLIERALYGARWLLAPVYLGLSLLLVLLVLKYFQELFHMFPLIWDMKEETLVLSILALIDMTLVGSLVVMVMLSGYENFVSTLDVDEGSEKLDWLGKLDAGSLKLKVATSIVAISSIHLLKVFMAANQYTSEQLTWYVVIHMTFVVSAVLMGWLDKFSKH